MRLLGPALLALTVATAFASAPFRGPRVSEAKHTIIEAQRASEGYAARLQKKCAAEEASIKSFSREVGVADEMAQKATEAMGGDELGEAAEDMERQVTQLLALRKRLGRHIDRVNEAYAAMHRMTMGDVKAAAALLRDLGQVLQTHDALQSPSLDPIDNEPVSANGSEPALLEVDEAAVASAAAGTGDIPAHKAAGFVDAYKSAVQLYNGGLSAARTLKADFEQERAALLSFREVLDTVVHARRTRLAGLEHEAQRAAAGAKAADRAMEAPASLLADHERILKGACADTMHVHDYFTEQRAHLLSDVEAGVVSAGTGGTGAAGSV